MNPNNANLSNDRPAAVSRFRTHDTFWDDLRGLPVVRDWKIARDGLFLATSIPMGIAAFTTLTVGLSAGIPLTFVAGLGLPVLAIMWGVLQFILAFERTRISAFMDVDIPTPDTWSHTEGGFFQRAASYLTHRNVWYSLMYLGALLPIACVELALVVWPLELLVSPVVVAMGGQIQSDLIGNWTINNGFESLIAFVVGLAVLVPFSALINITAKAHARFALHMIGKRPSERMTALPNATTI